MGLGLFVGSEILVLAKGGILDHPTTFHLITPDEPQAFCIMEESQHQFPGDVVQHGRHGRLEFPGIAGNPAINVQVGNAHGKKEAVAIVFQVRPSHIQPDLFLEHSPISHTDVYLPPG